MKDENVYRRGDNGRYIPYGICCEPDNMPDGIWYVRHRDYSRSTTSVNYMQGLFKVGDAMEIDLTKLCGMEDLVDYIMDSKEFRETADYSKGYSLNDIVHVCVAKLVEKAESQK